MIIVEYILDPQDKPRSYVPKSIPSYITDGGYWGNLDDKTLIGVGLEGSIPEDATTFTLAELQSRQRSIHAKHPMKKEPIGPDSEDMTVDEVNAAVKNWVDAR